MTRPVFGRDRDPFASASWAPAEPRTECAPGHHLVDLALERCTICGWLDPAIRRCATQGCIRPADYEVDVAKVTDLEFTNVLRSASFCEGHAFPGGLALLPGGPVA